ncbi:hypothetical protein MLD38_018792 [Melastoma candidum]|uniref:Uncharacterized protein n=1 Tax=Melastoma candidum TaxID=119954 RepID=A0ACB9QUV4_9MYRT|nr:hypothetical protein MLD38_018792 [Melastoma candidum]
MEGRRCGDGSVEPPVSVSFGRFDKDSLSWEKWSSFSPNKYLEEVEKCATPGSVARKAAYFEAHYRRIAARKAELLLLASDANGAPPSVPASSRQAVEEDEEEQYEEEDMITLEKERLSFEVVFGESTAGGVVGRCEKSDDKKVGDSLVRDDPKDEEEPQVMQMLRSDVGDASKSNGSLIIGREEAPDCRLPNVGTQNGIPCLEMSARIRNDAADLESWRKPRKSDPLNKEKIMEKAKKKPAPAIIKSPQVHSAPRRTSKHTPISPAPSMTTPFRKPTIDVSTNRNKGGPALDLKKVSPNHALGPTSSSNLQSFDPAAVAAPRRSLLMERMGDKDIIKRAFRTFQNNAGLSKSFSAQKSAPLALPADPSSTIRKENMRREAGSVVKKSNEVFLSKYSSGNSERVEKRIQLNINKKLEQKSTIKEVEKSRLTKDQREIDIRRPTQSIGFKATTMSALNRGQNRSLQRKVIKKQEIKA